MATSKDLLGRDQGLNSSTQKGSRDKLSHLYQDETNAIVAQQSSLPQTIQDRLTSSAYIALRQLNVEVIDDVIVVSGKVRSHYLKQIANTILQGLVRDNSVRVELAVTEG